MAYKEPPLGEFEENWTGEPYPGSERFGVTLEDVVQLQPDEMLIFDPRVNGKAGGADKIDA